MADDQSIGQSRNLDLTLRSLTALADSGLMAKEAGPKLSGVEAKYAIAITPAMQGLIDPDDAYDPIGMQFLPDIRELALAPSEQIDPIGDRAHMPLEGIVHRYPDRVLLKITHTCAVYCRFCFRREMVGPGKDPTMSATALDEALDYISAHPEIWEVILTGGDPLVLSARRLAEVMQRLDQIDHVKVIRLHTRIPIVDPQGMTTDRIQALTGTRKTVVVALHINHMKELTPQAIETVGRLARVGVSLVSQTVLLRGLNDDAGVLATLMRALVQAQIKPYYLHHPDLAPGTGHWRVSLDQGMRLMADLRQRVSGLCMPTYVLDIPGGFGKIPVNSDHVRTLADGSVQVCDPGGRWHDYPEILTIPNPTACRG